MPIYEYKCGKCGKTLEVMQKISDPPPAKCPKCKSKKMQRLLSQTSFQLKGDGWYITDYSNKLKPSENGKGDGNAATPAKTGAGSAPAGSSGGATPSAAPSSSTSTPASSGSGGTSSGSGSSSSSSG